jgi:hypothetical protein
MERKNVTSPLTKKIAALIALASGGALIAPAAKAVVILPGTSAAPIGNGVIAGTQLLNVTTPFVAKDILNNVVFSGSLQSIVLQQSGGNLEFVYQFSNDNNPNNDSIERFSVDDFTGFSTDVDYIPSTGASAPTLVSRQPAVTGDVVGYTFSGVSPGTSTDILTVETNATAFQIGSAALQDGGNVSIPAPVPAVPEPATIGLLVLSVSGLTLRRRRA